MRRDRHGRGAREIYSEGNFQADVLDAVERISAEWEGSLTGVEFSVADIPDDTQISLGVISLGSVKGNHITIYRRPIELRSQSSNETRQLVFDTVVEQVAELLGLDPLEVHEDYGQEE